MESFTVKQTWYRRILVAAPIGGLAVDFIVVGLHTTSANTPPHPPGWGNAPMVGATSFWWGVVLAAFVIVLLAETGRWRVLVDGEGLAFRPYVVPTKRLRWPDVGFIREFGGFNLDAPGFAVVDQKGRDFVAVGNRYTNSQRLRYWLAALRPGRPVVSGWPVAW